MADRNRRQPEGSFYNASTIICGIYRNSWQGWVQLLSSWIHNLSPVVLVLILPTTNGWKAEWTFWSVRQWLSLDGHPSSNPTQGSKLTKDSSRNFATGHQNLVAIQQLLVAEPSRCIFLSVVWQNKIWACNSCVLKKPLKMMNDRKNATVPVFNTMFKRSNIFRLKENSRQETKQLCYFFP